MTGGPGRRSRLLDHLVGALFAAVYMAILISTAHNLGYARDEGFYFTAARKYQKWFDVLDEDPARAMEDKVIGKHWVYNHEHPALMKTLFGFSERIFHKKLDLLSPSTALRLPGMLTGALAVYLIFLWGSFAWGRGAGAFAAVVFAMMPRVFYHAHLCCFDIPITFFWLLVVYLYWRSLDSTRFGIAAGAAFGLALAVKLNAFFIPFVLAIHFLTLYLRWRKAPRESRGRPPKPWAFLSGLVLAPPIFFAHWPWLWFDTIRHVGSYLGFHSNHPHYNTAYFGENIIQAPTPISYPFVLTLLTVPTVVIALFVAGALLRGRHHLPRKLEEKVEGFWKPAGPASLNGLDLLIFLNVLVPIAIIAFPTVPVFGGTKHWMTAMPFIAMFAGIGAARLGDVAAAALGRLPSRVVRVAVVAALLVPPIQQTYTSHPFGLASYVPMAGGAPGAADMGMLRQFWGYTTTGVLPFLNDRTPKGKGVWFHDTAQPSVKMFREEGLLRRDIRATNIKTAAYSIVHHELHMVRNESWVWNRYKTFSPVHVLTYQGVPIVSVYENPRVARGEGKGKKR